MPREDVGWSLPAVQVQGNDGACDGASGTHGPRAAMGPGVQGVPGGSVCGYQVRSQTHFAMRRDRPGTEPSCGVCATSTCVRVGEQEAAGP